jgi:hypothetical protein
MRSSSSSPSLSTSSLIQLRPVESLSSTNSDNLNNKSPPQSSSYSSKINTLFSTHKVINPIIESNTNSNSNNSNSSNFVINIPQSMTVFNLKDISSKLKSYKAISNNKTTPNTICLNKSISSPITQNNQQVNESNNENSISRNNNNETVNTDSSFVQKTIIQLKETLPLEQQNYSDYQNNSIDNLSKLKKFKFRVNIKIYINFLSS